MYKYSDRNENRYISLHDCRATKIVVEEGVLSFVFPEGFWVTGGNRHNYHKKLAYTGEAEVRFKTRDTEANITVYVFTETGRENKTVREDVPLEVFAEWLEGGMELEFLYSYAGDQAFAFECWLWFDEEPYHKECVVNVAAEDVAYCWNELHVEEPIRG